MKRINKINTNIDVKHRFRSQESDEKTVVKFNTDHEEPSGEAVIYHHQRWWLEVTATKRGGSSLGMRNGLSAI